MGILMSKRKTIEIESRLDNQKNIDKRHNDLIVKALNDNDLQKIKINSLEVKQELLECNIESDKQQIQQQQQKIQSLQNQLQKIQQKQEILNKLEYIFQQ